MNKNVRFELKKELVHKTSVHFEGIASGFIDMTTNFSSMGKLSYVSNNLYHFIQFITFDINYLLQNEIPKGVRLLRFKGLNGD